MNYRHAYHAGNFADVLKHLVLVHVVDYLKRKDGGFRIVDTHAGLGLYDLGGIEAGKTGEWRAGIGRLLDGASVDARQLATDATVSAYLDIVREVGGAGDAGLMQYPGSPMIARRLLREQDRLVVNELHPDDMATLKSNFARDRQTKVLNLDGWVVVKSALPPPERRGVILIDPPFECGGEFDRMAQALADGVRRFATGVYVLWYPTKDEGGVAAFKRKLTELDLGEQLAVELNIGRDPDGQSPQRLAGCGLVIHSPPFGLDNWLAGLLPRLSAVLAQGPSANWALTRAG